MSAARLKSRVAEFRGGQIPQPIPARDLLHALLDHIDLERFLDDGRARCVAELPEALLDALILWGSDEREIDEDIEGECP